MIARLTTREVSKTSKGVNCIRTAQQPMVKRLAVRSREEPLMVFRVGQANSGRDPLDYREVSYTPLHGPQ
jgi:hypothetical protein